MGEDAWLEAAYEDANGGSVDTACEDDDAEWWDDGDDPRQELSGWFADDE